MTNDTDSRALWRETLGDDADPTWDAFRMSEPPPLALAAEAPRQPRWIRTGLAASWLGIAALFAWNVALQRDVTAAREQSALVLLEAERSDRVLAGLATVATLDRDPAITSALLELLKTSSDPNVQLAALDLLVENVLKRPAARREVLDDIRHNRPFIERAMQALEDPHMKPIAMTLTLLALAPTALAENKNVTLPVTASHERLVVRLWEGDIRIKAGGTDAIQLIADCTPPDVMSRAGESGMRSLTAMATLPDIVASDEVITIRTGENGAQCSVVLTVPTRLDLHARVNRAGEINIDGWRGSLLAWSAEGDVRVGNFGGSLSVTAMSGNAEVSLGEGGIAADSAITAANGTLTLVVDAERVPALRAQARWGVVQTDLDMGFDQVVEGGATWFATPSDGEAPMLTLRNLNRSIVIRKTRT